jgi:hypothetical protein
MKKIAIGLLLGVVLCLSSVQEARADILGTYLIESCESKSESSRIFCLSFIHGAFVGYGWGTYKQALATDTYENPNVTICAPAESVAGQWERVVKKWLKEHPERLHEPAIILIVDAMRETFPCKDGGYGVAVPKR